MIVPRYWSRGLTTVAIAAVLLAISHSYVYPTWVELAQYDEVIRQLSLEKQRLEHLIREHDEIASRLSRLEALVTHSGYYLSAASAEEATRELIARFESIVESKGASSIHIQPDPTHPNGDRIKLHTRLTGDVNLLIELLHELEGSAPIMLIDELTIRPIQTGRQGSTNPPSDELNIRFDLIAFLTRAAA